VSPELRPRGQIERRGTTLRVKVYAGLDPVTGRRVYLQKTIEGTDRSAERQANAALASLIAQVDKQRSPSSMVSLAQTLDEFMRVSELEDTTRDTYDGYVRRVIKPALGTTPVRKVTARSLEVLYAELRRCRVRCDRKPFIEWHRTKDEHDCAVEDETTHRKCRWHECRPMAESTVRQIHSILSGALSLAERWEWIEANPARTAKRPRQKPPEPDPPTPSEAARLVEEAFRMDPDWGTLVWLVMTTGIRRGEVCALRFRDLDIDFDEDDADGEGFLRVRRNYVRRNKRIAKEKDTKTHQIRFIALDRETVALLREHRDRVRARLAELEKELTGETFIFTGTRTPDHSQPGPPDSVTQRYGVGVCVSTSTSGVGGGGGGWVWSGW